MTPPVVNWLGAAFPGWISETVAARSDACLTLGRRADVNCFQQKRVFSLSNNVGLFHTHVRLQAQPQTFRLDLFLVIFSFQFTKLA